MEVNPNPLSFNQWKKWLSSLTIEEDKPARASYNGVLQFNWRVIL